MAATTPRPLVVLGAASVAENVLDIADAQGREVLALVDETGRTTGTELGGVPIVGAFAPWVADPGVDLAVAIGHNRDRRAAAARLTAAVGAERLPALVHPGATVARRVPVGTGSIVMAGARILGDATVGAFCYVNANVVVAHGTALGDAAALAAGAVVGGRCRIGDGAFLGINTSVRESTAIGADAVVGAGSVVLEDLPALHVCLGAPARAVRPRNASDRYLR